MTVGKCRQNLMKAKKNHIQKFTDHQTGCDLGKDLP